MKLIIELDEKYYNDICNSETASKYSVLYALNGIRNGIPLEEELKKIKEVIKAKAENVDLLYKQTVTEIIDNHIKENKQ